MLSNDRVRVLIYGLLDPLTRLVRYVGKSKHGEKRARSHRKPSSLKKHSHKNHWIKSLHVRGLDYEIVILEVSPTDIDAAERFWIAYGRACGWPLTNATDGGEGMVNPSPETRAKMSTANTGKKHTAETRAALSAQRRQEIAARTPEQNREHFARGPKRHSADTCAKISRANVGKKHTPEARARISAWNKARHAER